MVRTSHTSAATNQGSPLRVRVRTAWVSKLKTEISDISVPEKGNRFLHPHHLAVELTERGQYLARVQKSVYWLRTPVKVCMNYSRKRACAMENGPVMGRFHWWVSLR